jgi:DeoR family transcriptional regulator of aga operon
VTSPAPQEAALNALMVKVARETVAVMDSSKLGQRCLSLIAPVAELHTVISDTSAPREAVEALRERGVEVMLV